MAVGLNSNTVFSINTAAAGAEEESWAVLGKGFKNIAATLNEVIYQATYLGDDGWASSEVTGGQLTVTLTGDRVYGDAAQDYIFAAERQFGFGDARKTQFKIENAQYELTGNCTLANITDAGGDANTVDAITVLIHFNGKPTVTDKSSASV